MKAAITAASGRLGSEIIQATVALIGKENVIAVARNLEKVKTLNVEARVGDYDNIAELKAAFSEVDIALLVSGMAPPDKRIIQHKNVIDAAKRAGVNRMVFTSIVGSNKSGNFNPIIESMRQTEEYMKNSGMDWTVGRNGLYMEPDLEYLDNYIQAGIISNCAADGKCGYTSRKELAFAYAKIIANPGHESSTYNLTGPAITQHQLAELFNEVFGSRLHYEPVSVEDYEKDRKEALGEFMGKIVAGIYEGIRNNDFDVRSDFEKVTGRPHTTYQEIMMYYNK
jgi:NAD(P)H dehydrogenase (quinone)